MAKLLNFSEAFFLGLHAAALLACREEILNSRKISELTGSSESHLASVLKQLVKKDIIASVRGPAGGFSLKADPEKLFLIEIYKVFEGEFPDCDCPFNKHSCLFCRCLFGDSVSDFFRNLKERMQTTTIAQFVQLLKQSQGAHHD